MANFEPGLAIGRARQVIAVAMVMAAGAAASTGQVEDSGQAEQRFRAETTLVPIEVAVTDRDGNVVHDLTRDEFVIEERGRAQTISTFAFVDLPLGTVAAPEARDDGTSGVSDNSRRFDGRVYLLVLDSAGEPAKQAARLFINQHFRPDDLMMVAFSAGPTNMAQGFTNDRSRLLAAVDQFRSTQPAAPLQTQTLDGRAVSEPAAVRMERRSNNDRTLRSLIELAEWSGETMPGRRKSLLFISEGVPGLGAVDALDQCDKAGKALTDLPLCEVIAASAKANVVIYPLDPRGLGAQMRDIDSGATTEQSPLGTNRQAEAGQLGLRVMGEDTGGLAIVNTNGFDAGLARVVRDSSSYYVLGFEPAAARAGTFRQVSVRVKRPGLEVRARRGYVLPGRPAEARRTAGVSEVLSAAIDDPLPVSDVPLAVFAVPFKGTGKNASILLGVEALNLTLTAAPQGNRFLGNAEVGYVFLMDGKVMARSVDTVRIAVAADRLTAASRSVRVLRRVSLAPGRYQLRVAIHDRSTGRAGSVLHNLDVPDFARARTSLAMSGIVLASTSARGVVSARDVRLDLGSGTPVVQRTFEPTGTLIATAEVYAGTPAASGDVVLTARVVGRDEVTAFEVTRQISSQELSMDRAHAHAVVVPLESLKPGDYTLELRARKEGQDASRLLHFAVAQGGG